MKISLAKINYILIVYLLFFCSLQDFVIPIIYKITGSKFIANLFFYQKDIILIILFIYSITRKNKPEVRNLTILYLIHVSFIIIMTISGIFNVNTSLIGLLSNTRNLILLPLLCYIGNTVSNKRKLLYFIENKWFPFIVIMSIIGLIEYVLDYSIGTRSFWTDTIGYTNFYVDIKHMESKMIMGLPANFYGNYGNGYFSTKRLVGLWANPLTSAYNLLPAGVYYFLKSTHILQNKRFDKKDVRNLYCLIIITLAIYYSRTRAILILFMGICIIYTIKNVRINVFLIILIIMALSVLFISIDFIELQKYLYDGSTESHIISIKTTLNNFYLSIIGRGIGYIGIYGSITTENAYLTILGNIGILGLTIYLVIFFRYIGFAKKNIENSFIYTIYLSGIAYLITGLISEQLSAFTSMAQFYIMLGLCGQMYFDYVKDIKYDFYKLNGKMYLQDKIIYNN